jgi:hypothetical protein
MLYMQYFECINNRRRGQWLLDLVNAIEVLTKLVGVAINQL